MVTKISVGLISVKRYSGFSGFVSPNELSLDKMAEQHILAIVKLAILFGNQYVIVEVVQCNIVPVLNP